MIMEPKKMTLEEIMESIHQMRMQQMSSFRDPPERVREIESAILSLQEELAARKLPQGF
jgi:hypothetical protein